MLSEKGKKNDKIKAFFKLKLFHVELSQNDRFVTQLHMFLLPYVLSLNLIFFKKMLDIVFFCPKRYDKMLAFFEPLII